MILQYNNRSCTNCMKNLDTEGARGHGARSGAVTPGRECSTTLTGTFRRASLARCTRPRLWRKSYTQFRVPKSHGAGSSWTWYTCQMENLGKSTWCCAVTTCPPTLKEGHYRRTPLRTLRSSSRRKSSPSRACHSSLSSTAGQRTGAWLLNLHVYTVSKGSSGARTTHRDKASSREDTRKLLEPCGRCREIRWTTCQ
jgi:hypothetical protein